MLEVAGADVGAMLPPEAEPLGLANELPLTLALPDDALALDVAGRDEELLGLLLERLRMYAASAPDPDGIFPVLRDFR